MRRGSVLFAGQSYYHAWYLSRELRKLGWRADVLNWDPDADSDLRYHGQDFRLPVTTPYEETIQQFAFVKDPDLRRSLSFYLRSLFRYDVFHFSNIYGISFGPKLEIWMTEKFDFGAEIRLLKRLGKKVVYSTSGCMDGVAQSTFASWGDRPVCADCPWRERPEICSDEGNLAWGDFRSSVADFQVLFGGNHADYNLDPRVHEVPEFFCTDPEVWNPDLEVPPEHRLDIPQGTVKIYHAVGNFDTRSEVGTQRNLKSTHLYVPLIQQLKDEGHDVELVFVKDIPSSEVRFIQAQTDIVVDMLTYGFFGANVREALMLGKPVVCYLREEWLEQMRAEVPGYVEELPVVSATPETVHDVLVDLIEHPEKRAELGRRGRQFAVKWHSAEAGARRFDAIYGGLLEGRPGTESFR